MNANIAYEIYQPQSFINKSINMIDAYVFYGAVIQNFYLVSDIAIVMICW